MCNVVVLAVLWLCVLVLNYYTLISGYATYTLPRPTYYATRQNVQGVVCGTRWRKMVTSMISVGSCSSLWWRVLSIRGRHGAAGG